jgi:hypothetical protein
MLANPCYPCNPWLVFHMFDEFDDGPVEDDDFLDDGDW